MLIRLAIILLLLPAPALAAPWRIDPDTSVTARVAWTGGTVEVRFPAVSGTIDFDENHPEDARASIVVSAGNATTGLPPADLLLHSQGYLDSARHPEIRFQLDRLTRTSAGTAEIEGRLTLRGITRPLTFAASVIRYGPAPDGSGRFEAGFDLSGEIDRGAFGSTAGLPDIAAILPLQIRLLISSR